MVGQLIAVTGGTGLLLFLRHELALYREHQRRIGVRHD